MGKRWTMPQEVRDIIVEMWNETETTGAKFSVGQRVKATPLVLGPNVSFIGIVEASNNSDEVEYLVSGYPLCLWESELVEYQP